MKAYDVYFTIQKKKLQILFYCTSWYISYFLYFYHAIVPVLDINFNCKSQAMKKIDFRILFFYVFFGFLILKLVYWSIFILI